MGLDECEVRVEVLDLVHEVVDENLSNLVEGVGEVGTSREMGKDLVSNKELKEVPEEVKVQEKCDELVMVDQGTSYNSSNLVEGVGEVGTSREVDNDSGSNKVEDEEVEVEEKCDELVMVDQDSSNSVNQEVVERVIVIESVESVQSEFVNGEQRKLEAKDVESGLSLVSMKAPKGMSETDSCVIDMKCRSHKGFYESSHGERICRICHLAFGQASDATAVENGSATSGDFIQLGCACKDELGIAHVHCAEVWFKLKGNRLCEICGETAKNVSGVASNGFMEEWNDRRFMDNDGNSSRRFGGCWRGQPFCNFLMACLVIAFILPWFFHVDMF